MTGARRSAPVFFIKPTDCTDKMDGEMSPQIQGILFYYQL
jgi:hypothetical protein